MEDGGPCKVRVFSVGKSRGLRGTTGDCEGLRGTAGDYRAPVILFLKRGTKLQGGPDHFIPWRTAGDGGGNGLWP